MDYLKLINAAISAREMAYSPYSDFSVGAALLTDDGKIYTGCNVENASFSLTSCAERTAFFNAISDGAKDFSAIAIVGGKNGKEPDYCPPCGACRQVMSEFCKAAEFKIIIAKSETAYKEYTLAELLPLNFNLI